MGLGPQSHGGSGRLEFFRLCLPLTQPSASAAHFPGKGHQFWANLPARKPPLSSPLLCPTPSTHSRGAGSGLPRPDFESQLCLPPLHDGGGGPPRQGTAWTRWDGPRLAFSKRLGNGAPGASSHSDARSVDVKETPACEPVRRATPTAPHKGRRGNLPEMRAAKEEE